MRLFPHQTVDPIERGKVLALIQRVFQENRKIDTAQNVARQAIAAEPRGIASAAFEEARLATLNVLDDVSARARESAFWPVLDDPKGVRLMFEMRSALDECHKHQLSELRTFGASADAFRRGEAQGPVSVAEIRRAQEAFNRALDGLGGSAAKLARHYGIPHQELQRVI